MTYGPDCIALTKESEGCKLNAYPDPATGGKPWTIGWGHTFGVRAGMAIYQDQADAWLLQDLDSAAAIVNQWVKEPLTQGQFDALTDFVFNVGQGMKGPNGRDGFVWLRNGNHSTMLRLLNEGKHEDAGHEFAKWNLPPLPGIAIRRKREMDLYFKRL